MKFNDYIKNVSRLVVRDILSFFPYLLILYVIVFIMSLFSSLWHSFWQVPALHICLAVFAVIFIWVKTKDFYFDRRVYEDDKNTTAELLGGVKSSFILSWRSVIILIRKTYFFLYRLIRWLIYLIRYFTPRILPFCLRTVLIVWKNIKNGQYISWTGGVALFFLTLCPFLLIFKKDAIAEQSAVYAFYFLVISVVLMIFENYFDKTPENIEN